MTPVSLEAPDGCDDELFGAVYRAQFPVLMRVAFLMTGSNEVAEEPSRTSSFGAAPGSRIWTTL